MPTQILAVGKTDLASADQVVVAGSSLTVCLKDDAGPAIPEGAVVEVRLKADNGEYFQVDTLTTSRCALIIDGAGTYQFFRRAGVACGVFSG